MYACLHAHRTTTTTHLQGKSPGRPRRAPVSKTTKNADKPPKTPMIYTPNAPALRSQCPDRPSRSRQCCMYVSYIGIYMYATHRSTGHKQTQKSKKKKKKSHHAPPSHQHGQARACYSWAPPFAFKSAPSTTILSIGFSLSSAGGVNCPRTNSPVSRPPGLASGLAIGTPRPV